LKFGTLVLAFEGIMATCKITLLAGIANYVTVTELAGTRGQLALKMVIKQQKLMLKTSMEV